MSREMTPASTHQIPPIEHWLNQAAPAAHTPLFSTYDKLLSDPSVGKSRAQSQELGGWGASTQRLKEAAGLLQTWTDGTMVRVSTVSIYLHILDLIVASHPVNGPARKARTPLKSFRKGHRQAALERKEGQAIRAP
jgi:hypothetical protein